MDPVDERRRTSFDERAEAYDAIRPRVPDALARAVVARTGARRVLEIGAGTGLATIPFACAGCEVVALEPGPRLARILRAKTASRSNVRVVESRFEDFPEDERFDLVLAASSLHWVDPTFRYAKSARVGRHLAVVQNEVDAIDPAVRAEFDEAYDRFTGPDGGNDIARDAVGYARRESAAGIDASGLYGPVHVETYGWETVYTSREYVALLDTYSHYAVRDPAVRHGLYSAIAAAIDRHGGRLRVPYVTLAAVAAARA